VTREDNTNNNNNNNNEYPTTVFLLMPRMEIKGEGKLRPVICCEGPKSE
jgi:hypothetical protein